MTEENISHVVRPWVPRQMFQPEAKEGQGRDSRQEKGLQASRTRGGNRGEVQGVGRRLKRIDGCVIGG